MFYFANWGFLVLLILVPVLAIWYWKRGHKNASALRYSSIKNILQVKNRHAFYKVHGPFVAKLIGIALLIMALARPQSGNTRREFTTEGIDIMLVLDISSSMKAIDFRPNRLEAAKSVAQKFIEGRQSDRIGLIVFAAESFLQCPLTIDYGVLKDLLNQVDIVEEKYDGTAIGMAIANATNRLRESQAKSKIMILLSDGCNNAGEIDPRTAANLANAFEIKIYTIGAGKLGQAPYPIELPNGQIQYRLVNAEIDEVLLQDIANQTGGKYFRATDEKSLAMIYEEISGMEKTEVKVHEFVNYNELYPYFLVPGFLLVALSGLIGLTVWRRTP